MRNQHWCKRNSLDKCLHVELIVRQGKLFKNKQNISYGRLNHSGATIKAGGYWWHEDCLEDWQKKFIKNLKNGKNFYFHRRVMSI